MSQPTRIERMHQADIDALDAATRKITSDPELKPFLWWVIGICGVYQQNVQANSSMYILEGMRAVGLKVLDQVGKVDPLAYPTMLLASARREQEKQAVQKQDEDDDNGE